MKLVCIGCGREINPQDYIVCGDYVLDKEQYEYFLHMTDECLLCFLREQFLENSYTYEGEACRYQLPDKDDTE